MIHKLSILVITICCCAIYITNAIANVTDDPSPNEESQKVFLCIYADHLKDAADAWVQHRNVTGWDARAVAISTILPDNETTIHTNGYASQLQTHIQKQFQIAQNKGVRGGYFAVMLLGDVNTKSDQNNIYSATIPTFIFQKPNDPDLQSWFEPNNYATDHNYQLANDRDTKPDFLLGRVPAQTNTEAMVLLNKIKRYELDSEPGAWRKRITYIAGEGRFGAMDSILEDLFISMIERVVPYHYDIHVTYAHPDSPYCAPPTALNDIVLDRIGEGSLLVNYLGHGSPRSLDSLYYQDQRYDICSIGDVPALSMQNNSKRPVMVIIACSTGRYDLPNGELSLSESLLFNVGGPIAIISGSRVTHPYPNSIYQNYITEQMCQNERSTIGAVDLVATRDLIAGTQPEAQKIESLASVIATSMAWKTSPRDHRILHASLYNLIGDPATKISYPTTQDRITDLTFDYDTNTASGVAPAEYAGNTMTVTIETSRILQPHKLYMKEISGRSDPELELKAKHNYPIANDKRILAGEGVIDDDGRFHIELHPITPGSNDIMPNNKITSQEAIKRANEIIQKSRYRLPRHSTPLWIKAYSMGRNDQPDIAKAVPLQIHSIEAK